jgi:hypothetical protein
MQCNRSLVLLTCLVDTHDEDSSDVTGLHIVSCDSDSEGKYKVAPTISAKNRCT